MAVPDAPSVGNCGTLLIMPPGTCHWVRPKHDLRLRSGQDIWKERWAEALPVDAQPSNGTETTQKPGLPRSHAHCKVTLCNLSASNPVFFQVFHRGSDPTFDKQ